MAFVDYTVQYSVCTKKQSQLLFGIASSLNCSYNCRATLCIARSMPSCGVCLSVRQSVRPSRSCILSKRVNIISNFFHCLVFTHQTLWQRSDGNPLTGASNAGSRWGRQKVAILDQYLASSPAVNTATARYYQHGAAGPGQVVSLTAGSNVM